ncbi:PGF-CTERM protein/surface glycoprotein, partial [Halomicrobium zhouii]
PMTTTNDKLRSLFLAALMVFSVFAMTVALPGSAAANHDSEAYSDVDADAHLTSDTRYWGETILVFDNSEDENYELWTTTAGSDNDQTEFVRTLTLDDDGYATFSTDGLSGDYEIRESDGDIANVGPNGELSPTSGTSDGDATFSVTTQTLDAEFEDSDVNDEDEDVELTIDTNRGAHDVRVSADGLDADDLRDIFTNQDNRDGEFTEQTTDGDTLILQDVSSGDYRTNFSGISTGEYTFDFEANDTEASSSASINVSDAAEGDIQFANDVPQDQVGDVADITLEMDNTQEGTLTIGSADQNYWIVATVEDGDEDGEVTVQFNSYTAGAYDGDTPVLSVEDSDDDVTVQREGGDFNVDEPNYDILDATEYDMNVSTGINYDGDEAHADAKGSNYHDPADVGALSLQDRSTDNVTVMTAPEAFSEWSDADAINAGMGSNVTQANEIAQQDYVVVQIEASGLEGYYESLDNKDNFLNTGDATSLVIEEANPGANAGAETLAWANANEGYNIVADGNNNTYYVAVDTGSEDKGDDDFSFEEDTEYSAEFSVLGSEGDLADTYGDDDTNPLNVDEDDNDEAVSGNFDVVAGESSFDLNEDDLVLVEAADNQTVSGTTNWAPGSELTLSIESDDSTSPFLTRPDAEVQPDGTFEANADFSDLSEGTNLTVTLGHLSEDFDEDGQVVAQVSEETETATPTETTETATEEPTESTEEATEETTEESEDTETDTPTDDSGPGFTVIAALGALIAAALLAVRRNN